MQNGSGAQEVRCECGACIPASVLRKRSWLKDWPNGRYSDMRRVRVPMADQERSIADQRQTRLRRLILRAVGYASSGIGVT